jgi:hypothetical protein
VTVPIIEAKATGHEVTRIINEKLAPSLEGENQSSAVIAMLTMIMLIMKPVISAEDIQQGVLGVSQWMCLFLSSLDDGDEDGEKRKAN